MPDPILLTRPALEARRFARMLRAVGVEAPILFAPVLQILPSASAAACPAGDLAFTSEAAVRIAASLWGLRGRTVFTVGDRTAAAAAAGGAVCRSARGDVGDLERLIVGAGSDRIVHVRGAHVAGDLVARLRRAGIAAEARVIYDQVARPLGPAALAALHGRAILPLFSPRSARLLAEAGRVGPGTRAAAISPRAAAAWHAGPIAAIAPRPTAQSMAETIAALVAPDAS